MGAVDDGRHATELAEHRLAKGWGPARIEHDLDAAGIEEALIRATLASLDEQAILSAGRVAIGNRTGAEAWQRLGARGFDEAVAERLVGLPDES